KDDDQPVEREAAELRVANAGELRIGHARELLGIAHREPARVEHTNDLGCSKSARLFEARIGPAEIAIGIAAAAHQLSFVLFHFRRLGPICPFPAGWKCRLFLRKLMPTPTINALLFQNNLKEP